MTIPVAMIAFFMQNDDFALIQQPEPALSFVDGVEELFLALIRPFGGESDR